MVKQKQIPNKMYFRIGEVADIVGVKPYVLRYWETEFQDIKPSKSQSGQRLYRRKDVEILVAVKELLYDKKFTINGARQHLKDTMKDSTDVAGDEPTVEIGKEEMIVEASSPETKKILNKIKNELQRCAEELRK